MALIICPNCGKEVSDKAETCIQCGFVLKEKPIIKRVCKECGTEFDESLDACPNCGCPYEEEVAEEGPQKVEVTNVNIAIDEGKKKKVTTAIVVALIVVLLAVGIVFAQKKSASNSYGELLADCTNTMLMGAAKAESTGGLIHDVWANTIYENDDSKTDKYTKDSSGEFYDDFNTSLMMLMFDDSFQKDVDSIKANQEEVQAMMKDLKNPPEEYADAYDAIKEFYDAYTRLVTCAVDPSGNLQSYTQTFNQADTDTSNCYKAMKLYID